MRIGIDARELVGQRTGTGRYLAELCTCWRDGATAAAHRFVLYGHAPGPDASVLGPPFEDASSERFTYRHVPAPAGPVWEQLRLPAVMGRDDLDVFFGPNYTMPLRGGVPGVVTMHDVSFVAHPEWFRWREGLRRRWLAARSVAAARAVITVSEFSRNEVLRHYGVDPDRVHAIRSGMRRRDASDREHTVPIVLYVGSIFNRRHLPTLIRAVARLVGRIPDTRLVIVGDDRSYPRESLPDIARDAGIADRVTVRAYVAEEELETLYRQARVFAFLSEYEGFGLTPLEALSAGVPALVGDTPVARELYDDAVLYVPPDDEAAVADALAALLTNDARRRALLANAAVVLPRFSWPHAAHETLAVIEGAARAASA